MNEIHNALDALAVTADVGVLIITLAHRLGHHSDVNGRLGRA